MNTHNSNETTQDKRNKKQRKRDKLRLFIFKPEFLKTSVALRSTLQQKRAELKGQLGIVKLRMFRVRGT
jgi:hypothetical protein